MEFFKKLFGLDSDKVGPDTLIEAGVCPNCWGQQEYDGKFVEYVEDKTKSNVNNESTGKKAFVQQFIEDHVTGIRLKSEGDLMVCPGCTAHYKKVSDHAD